MCRMAGRDTRTRPGPGAAALDSWEGTVALLIINPLGVGRDTTRIVRSRTAGTAVGQARRDQLLARRQRGAMSSVQPFIDAAGRRRSPATMPGCRASKAPRNKGQRYPADPPTVDEIVAVMRQARHARYGHRLNGLIVVLWRAGLRINEALSLTETDHDERHGSILAGTERTIADARSAWTPGQAPTQSAPPLPRARSATAQPGRGSEARWLLLVQLATLLADEWGARVRGGAAARPFAGRCPGC